MRKRLGWWGLLLAIALLAFLVWVQAPAGWRLIIALPIFFSANGFLQGFMHFCAGFGMRGLYNFGPEVGKTDTVSQAEFRAKDRKKAHEIFMHSAAIAIIIALIAFFA